MDPLAIKVVRIGIPVSDHYAMGPGKADLLDAIHDTGSISAAARRMQMSYRRAWLLVDEMNRLFVSPVVESRLGGAGGGGARVTELGHEALRRYRVLQDQAWSAVRQATLEYQALLRPVPAEATPDTPVAPSPEEAQNRVSDL